MKDLRVESGEAGSGPPVPSFRTLGRDLLSYGLLAGLSRSVHIVLLPILTRQFSTEEYGIVDIIATVTSVLTLFMGLTLQSAIARSWFEAGKRNERKQLVSTSLAFVLGYGGLVLGAVTLASEPLAHLIVNDRQAGTYVILGAGSALFTALVHMPEIVLRMERRIVAYTFVSLSQTVLFVAIALFLVLRFDSGVVGVFLGQVISAALALCVGIALIWRFVGLRFSQEWLTSTLQFSLPLVPAVLVSKVNKYLDRILLLVFIGLGGLGVFGAAARIAALMNLIVQVCQQAWTPLAIAHIDEREGRGEFYRRGLNYYAGGLAGVGLVLSAYAKEVMALVVPEEYVAGYIVISWLVGAQILHGSVQFTNLGMIVRKKTSGNSKAAWLGASVNIALGLILIPKLGIEGAAIGSFVGGMIFTSTAYRISQSIEPIDLDVAKTLGILGCYIVSSISFIAFEELAPTYAVSVTGRSLVLTVALVTVGFLSVDREAVAAVRSAVKSLAQG